MNIGNAIVIAASGDFRPGVWGGRPIRGRQEGLYLLKYQRLSATIVGCYTKVVTFCRPRSGYFLYSIYVIFQGIKTVWKRFISLIQKMFQTGYKQWASFFTSYTYLVYPQNVFKSYKACWAQAFATVLAIRSEIYEEQCLKRIPDLIRSRMALLGLGCDNSCATIGLK